MATTPARPTRTRSSTPTVGTTSKNAQQQLGTVARPGSNSHTGWDIDELMWDSHGNLDPRGRLATDRPHVAKLYGAYQFNFGTQVGAFFYGGSGTPITRRSSVRISTRRWSTGAATWAARRCSRARTCSSRTSSARRPQARAPRAEHPEPVQPEDGHAHLQLLEQGGPGGSQTRAANAIDFSEVNLARATTTTR
jgi:hypothetical protein